MKTHRNHAKRILAMMLLMVCIASALVVPASAASIDQMVRYVPVSYTVYDDEIVVDGYLVNMNQNAYVGNFTDFEIQFYDEGIEMFSGSFNDLHSFTIAPQSMYHETLTIHYYNDDVPLYPGYYDCDDSFYASFSAQFTTWYC